MRILGIHDGHTSTACLIEDGRILAMASEERFNRVKNAGGVPVRAIEWVLTSTGTIPSQLDSVAVVGLIDPITDISSYEVSRHRFFSLAAERLPGEIIGSRSIIQPYLKYKGFKRRQFKAIKEVLARWDIPTDRIALVEHHTAHAATACYLSWYRDAGPVLAITIDGSGDGVCATVSVCKDGRIERVLSIPSYHSPGIMYSRVTQYLGMKPLEHEYKVMGLAPYAPDAISRRAHQFFERYIALSPDGLEFVNTSGTWGNSFLKRLVDDLTGVRFDGVAAGIQRRIEELVIPFVLNWVRRTGIRNVALSGGVFMNVKANMLLAESPEIDRLFIMPSCGDESIALGAALQVYAERRIEQPTLPQIEPLQTLYFGPEFTDEEIEQTLFQYRDRVRSRRVDDIEVETARLLVEHNIVGRLAGRMEWGARALGNRSILANPTRWENIRRLNAAIKMRDFWMPFAPSILSDRHERYIQNPRQLPAPYMILAFRSTDEAQCRLLAALHPFDLTCRPQLVEESWNPPYYRLLKHFEDLTGIGGVVNTSFNIHGDPIVCSPADAIETLLNSGLDYVTCGPYLVQRG